MSALEEPLEGHLAKTPPFLVKDIGSGTSQSHPKPLVEWDQNLGCQTPCSHPTQTIFSPLLTDAQTFQLPPCVQTGPQGFRIP